MPKLKSVKGVRRRFKVTGTGRLLAFRPGRRHLLGSNRAKIKRHLRRPLLLSKVETRRIRALIPYA